MKRTSSGYGSGLTADPAARAPSPRIRIGADVESRRARRPRGHGTDRRMLAAERHHVRDRIDHQEHVHIHVRNELPLRYGRKVNEVLRPLLALLLAGERDEKYGALRPRTGGEVSRDFNEARDAGAVVVRAVIQTVAAVRRRMIAEVVEVRGDDDVFVAQFRVAAGEDADDVLALELREVRHRLHRGRRGEWK